MKTGLLSFFFFFGSLLLASAQSSGSAAKGSNPDSDAPVNVSEPSLRPAQPATYSATPVPDAQKGQYYVNDNRPADGSGKVIEPISPEQEKKRQQLKKEYDAANKTQPAPKSVSGTAKPARK